MPIGNSRTSSRDQILTPEIQEQIATIGKLIPVDSGYNDGPARRFRMTGAKGEIGFISALSHHFCNHCNRLRLTADGKLRACLLSDHHESVKTVLRNGGSDEQIAEIFRTVVRQKAAKHNLCPNGLAIVKDQMQGIGG
jgi:cyclic pyranopterin phosphate synthase